ncbi:hypothetical protein ABZV31_32925 [Streptomyces sp. NPDC005202]|uniref:hypothetical protein n=1 Tax=Streptomyces sp. NPDC005202 TaxID=3157021 RepID=UPI0033BA73CF
MNYRRAASGRLRLVGFAAVTVLVSVLAGCGGDEERREYAVPHTLCGTPVDSDELAPFLPPGRRITVRDNSHTAIKGCELLVDGKLIVSTTQAWLERGRTTAYFASAQTLEVPDRAADEGRFRYSGNQAFGKTQGCVDTRHDEELYTAVQADGSKHKDADAMKRLIISYTKEVENSAACTEGAQ